MKKYKVGPRKKELLTKSALSEEETKYTKAAVNNTVQTKVYGIRAVISSPWLLRNFLSSVKVVLLNLRTMKGTPSSVVQNVKLAISGRSTSSYNSLSKDATVHPEVIPIQNIKFQKLSLFILDSKNPFAALSRPRGIGLTLVGSGLDTWLFGPVKSCIPPFFRDHWFKIYTSIVPGFLFARKGIIAVALGACFNFSGAVAFALTDLSPPILQLNQFIQLAEKRHNIPSGLLVSIAKVESGFKPNAINIAGSPVFARNKVEAARLIRESLASGTTNIDVGIMQINYRWHKGEFKSVEEMLDPKQNIKYAAWLLSRLYKQYGGWHEAMRHYHSANSDHHCKYSRKIVMEWLQIR